MQSLYKFVPASNERKNKSDLKKVHNLKTIFNEIRDYFAGNVTGITRDESIAKNLMILLFCKIYDEMNQKSEMHFSIQPGESQIDVKNKIDLLFNLVKKQYSDLFDANDEIELEPKDLHYIISKLEPFSILSSERDVIGDAFEEIIGRGFRGGEGQFFTPRNVVKFMIEVLQPKEGEKIVDPACGSAGFLAYVLRYFLTSGIKDFKINGIDKDNFLSKLAKTYLLLLGGGDNCKVFCENSLNVPEKWSKQTRSEIDMGSYDVILTNPPFGAKIPVLGKQLLEQYKLGHEWKFKNEAWQLTTKVQDKQPPQILFIERCIQLLKDGGRMGIVLPEGIFGNPSDRYIWEFLSQHTQIIGIISLSQETFQPSTHTKTSILFLKKTKVKSNIPVFMAVAQNIGHNKNGKETYKITNDGTPILDEFGNKILDDDLPSIVKNFQNFVTSKNIDSSHLGFLINQNEIKGHIYIPEYYDPEIKEYLSELEKTGEYKLSTINDLVKKNYISISRGNEIGSQFYGTGDVPFVRTTDIVNWEIKFDPVKSVAEEVYEKYKTNQDVQPEDILFVNDGTFLIGRSSMVTELDKKIILQSHLKIIRVFENNFVDSYYLFYLLNCNIVQRQIQAKTFVQATISTIGNRLKEIILPIHSSKEQRDAISLEIKNIIIEKTRLRKTINEIREKSI